MRKEDVLEIERQQKLHEMKSAVHSKYSSIAPSIFLKKWEQQSFHDIGERALRKKNLETLPADIFLFLYENYSPVSGTDVFSILTSYIDSDQTFPSKYYSQVVQAISASNLAEDDFYPVIDLAIGMMEGSETIEFGLNIMDCLAGKKWPKPVSSHFKQYAIKEYLRYCDHLLISSNQAIAQRFQDVFCKLKEYQHLNSTIWSAYNKTLSMIQSDMDAIMTLSESCHALDTGMPWISEVSNPSDTILVKFLFPNGKYGDIDMYLASKVGTPNCVGGLTQSIEIPVGRRDVMELLIGDPYGSNAEENPDALRYLTENHRMFNLAKLLDMIDKDMLSKAPNCVMLDDDFLQGAESSIRRYFQKITDKRNQVYEQVIADGKATSSWKSEQQLYTLAKELYPDAVYQYHADWLGLQSLDVYIPSINTAIEYQGIQHYQPVDLFGGEKGFEQRKKLDAKKRQLCRKTGVRLVYWKYDVPISGDLLKKKLSQVKKTTSKK